MFILGLLASCPQICEYSPKAAAATEIMDSSPKSASWTQANIKPSCSLLEIRLFKEVKTCKFAKKAKSAYSPISKITFMAFCA